MLVLSCFFYFIISFHLTHTFNIDHGTQVLKKIEQLKLKHVPSDQYSRHLDSLLEPLKDETVDHVSHYVLRLGFCRSEEFRRWLLTHETALIKYRLGAIANGANGSAFVSVLPEAKPLQKEELDRLLPSILAATPGLTLQTANKIYAVPFTHALDLIQTRQILVLHGLAYIPQSKLLHLVTAKFRTQLSRQLVLLSSVPLQNSRMHALIHNLATVSASPTTDAEYETSGLTPTNVQSHLKHMPLCMVNLQTGLSQDKKLKHWGRLQYGLFLKGAGLSLEDALVYFERQFVTSNFQKEYAYNVRHMYGKEGKRASYPPYNCSKIIHGNPPNANDHHGCPYKHGTVQHVTTLLQKLGVAPKDQTGIVTLQKSHQYQLACVEHFKVSHRNTNNAQTNVDNVGNHPNAWFQASVVHAKATGTAVEQTSSGQTLETSSPMAAVSP